MIQAYETYTGQRRRNILSSACRQGLSLLDGRLMGHRYASPAALERVRCALPPDIVQYHRQRIALHAQRAVPVDELLYRALEHGWPALLASGTHANGLGAADLNPLARAIAVRRVHPTPDTLAAECGRRKLRVRDIGHGGIVFAHCPYCGQPETGRINRTSCGVRRGQYHVTCRALGNTTKPLPAQFLILAGHSPFTIKRLHRITDAGALLQWAADITPLAAAYEASRAGATTAI